MADFKLVDGEDIQLTSDEQAAHDTAIANYNSPAQVEVRLLSALAAHATAVRTNGTTVTCNGTSYQMLTDGEDSMDFMGAFILASGNSGYSAEVKTANGYVGMSATTILGVGALVATWVAKCRASEAAIAADVSTYSTTAAICTAFDTAMSAS